VNGGLLCKIGRFDPLVEKRQRIKTPLVRKNGRLEPASWEEALGKVAQSIKPLVGRPGNGVAAVASTRLPAESLALFKQLFADRIQSDMVTSLEEGQPSALPAAVADELGQSFEASLDILRTADCVLTIGVNLVDNHQVAGFFIKRNIPLGSKLIVVDPQANGMDDMANFVLKTTTGSDLELVKGLQAAIVKAKMERYAAPVMNPAQVLAEASRKTGLAEAEVSAAARALASAAKPVIVYGKGITANGNVNTLKAEALKALVTLARITGASLISVKGEANSLAAAQYRLDRVFELNGHQVVYVALGDDDPSQRLIQRLEKAPFLAVQTAYHSPLTEMAQVVLPVTRWVEQDGHYLSLDGRLQMAHKALQAPASVWPNEQVFTRLAEALGLALNGNWKELLSQRVAPVKITEN
jgi:formate dehydrogenase major subunit